MFLNSEGKEGVVYSVGNGAHGEYLRGILQSRVQNISHNAAAILAYPWVGPLVLSAAIRRWLRENDKKTRKKRRPGWGHSGSGQLVRAVEKEGTL